MSRSLHHASRSSNLTSQPDADDQALYASELLPIMAPQNHNASLLSSLGLKSDDDRVVKLNVEILKRLWTVETSFWRWFRWSSLVSLPTRLAQFPFIKETDLGKEPSAENHRIFPQGALPLRQLTALQSTAFMDGFTEGFGLTLRLGLKLTLTTLLAYQLIAGLNQGDITGFVSLLRSYFNGDTNSIQEILINFDTPQGKYLSLLFTAPFLGGLFQGIFAGSQTKTLTDEDWEKTNDYFTHQNPEKFSYWYDFFRWVLPLHPAGHHLKKLETLLTWRGDFLNARRIQAFQWLKEMQQRGGYTKIVAEEMLANIAHAHSLQQWPLIQKYYDSETQFLLLQIKAEALALIHQAAPSLRKAWRHGKFLGLIQALYAHYLKWTLADSNSRPAAFFMLVFKLGKTAVSLLIIQTLLRALISYLQCPQPYLRGFTIAGGLPASASDFSQSCIDTYIAAFDSFYPGQPLDTLLPVIARAGISGDYSLDLSHKAGLDGTTTAAILSAFQQKGISITRIDLSRNALQVADMSAICPALPVTLREFKLANNQYFFDENMGTAFSNCFPQQRAQQLTALDLSGNTIGDTTNSALPIGQALSQFIALNVLNLSNNGLGPSGGYGSANGTIAIMQSLNNLTALTELNLSNNNFFCGPTCGTSLSQSLAALTQLTSLDLTNDDICDPQLASTLTLLTQLRYIGIVSFNANCLSPIIAVVKQLQEKGVRSDYSLFDTPEKITQHLDSLPNNLSVLNLSGQMRYLPSDVWQNFSAGLSRFTQLRVLDLSYNDIARSDTGRGEESISIPAICQSFSALFRLVSLNLSGNFIGISSPDDGFAIGESFSMLPNLQALNLSRNFLGGDVVELPGINPNSSYAIAQNLNKLTTLISLDLSNNVIDQPSYGGTADDMSVVLARNLAFLKELAHLDLSNIGIDTSCCYSWSESTSGLIGQSFYNLTQLVLLDLSQNSIGSTSNSGPLTLAQNLRLLTQLTSLDLSSNSIDRQNTEGTTFLAITQSLANLTQLQTLNVDNAIAARYMLYSVLEAFANVVITLSRLTQLGVLGLGSGLFLWQDAASTFGQISSRKLESACEAQLCFNQTMAFDFVIPTTSGASVRFELPLYFRYLTRSLLSAHSAILFLGDWLQSKIALQTSNSSDRILELSEEEDEFLTATEGSDDIYQTAQEWSDDEDADIFELDLTADLPINAAYVQFGLFSAKRDQRQSTNLVVPFCVASNSTSIAYQPR